MAPTTATDNKVHRVRWSMWIALGAVCLCGLAALVSYRLVVQSRRREAAARLPVWVFEPKRGMDQPYITAWRVLGPFPWTEPSVPAESALHNEAVRRQLSHPFLSQLTVEGGRNQHLPAAASGIPSATVSTTNGLVRLHKVMKAVAYQVAYAECDVISSADQDAVLLPESDDGMKVWLNGEPAVTIDAIRSITMFEGHTLVRLRRGTNHLMVKLARTRQTSIWDPWDFAVGLRSPEGALDEIAGRGLQPFFSNAVVGVGGELVLDLTLFPPSDTLRLSLSQRGAAHDSEYRGGRTVSVPLTDFKPGPIDAVLHGGRHDFAEPLLHGSPREFLKTYRRQLPAYFSNPRHRMNLGALLDRYEHLLEPAHLEDESPIWQKKIAQLSWQIAHITADIDAGRDPYRGVPGTWLRGYASKLDGQTQYYLLHAPPQAANGRPFPLVIELPYDEFPIRPYLHSYVVSHYADLSLHDRAADLNGFGYLWMNNRGNSRGLDFGVTELVSALAEVQRDYAIDADRIYLFGGCSGGLYSLALANDYPQRFAALGIVTPSAEFRRVVSYDPESPTDKYACFWLADRSPVARMGNLLNIPVLAIHGDEDAHNPISESELLDTAARAHGVPLSFLRVQGGTELRWPSEPLYTSFQYFRTKARVRSPERISYNARSEKYGEAYWLRIERFADPLHPAMIEGRRTADNSLSVRTDNVARYSILLDKLDPPPADLTVFTNGRTSFSGKPSGRSLPIIVEAGADGPKNGTLPGPIADAFSEPFLVVAGSEGSGAGAAKMQARGFLESWRNRYFTSARSKSDTEVTEADMHSYNLVLFGTAQSNRILRKIAGKLPLQYGDGGVSLGGRSWTGTGYSIQALFPNPLAPSRYVVIPGDPECKQCPADASQLTLHGWYDAAIWKLNAKGVAEVVSVGNFDRSWQHFIPTEACH